MYICIYIFIDVFHVKSVPNCKRDTPILRQVERQRDRELESLLSQHWRDPPPPPCPLLTRYMESGRRERNRSICVCRLYLATLSSLFPLALFLSVLGLVREK